MEHYTLKDFTLISMPSNALDRAQQFKNKWLENPGHFDRSGYWLEADTGIKPEMILKDIRTGKKQKVISFISNDYLGMSQHKEVIQAGIDGLLKYGAGACASPMIGGYLDIHRQLEKEIAEFTGQEDALIFSSGFGVNVGVLNALLGKDDIAFIDFKVHRSVLDGLFLTNVKKVGHNDMEYLEFALKNERHKYKTAMVIIDGVYSQDGDIALLPEIVSLCKKYDTLVYLDDAHGMGVLGENGRGIAEHFNLLGQVDIITGTLSKSFGAVGGFVACSKDLINYLKFHANTSIFSASPTPQVTCSVLKAIELIKTDKSILKKLWTNVHYLRKRFTEEGFDIKQTISPIFPLMTRNVQKNIETTALLKENNIYAIGVGFPAVTDKDSRVRISLSASHEIKHLDRLIDVVCEIDKKLGIRKII
jgi:glycine C-acetyltransferase